MLWLQNEKLSFSPASPNLFALLLYVYVGIYFEFK